jgi:transglutaminase-like putative cysteine protease
MANALTATAAAMHARWIPRHSFMWLLIAQIAVIAPHIERLPIVIVFGWLLAAGWRTWIFQGRGRFPHAVIKLGLVVICLFGIRKTYGNWIGLEPSVALLITCFSFKLLESKTRREAYLLLFLGYFVAVTEFLFEQGLGTTLYMLLPIVLLTTALIALHQPEPLRFEWRALRAATTMALQAVPLMLLLFLVFPRLAPLWQVPMPNAQARTGMSDELSPGDIAQLSQSDALAFRVQFENATPPPNAQLYWRGLVLDDFDGRRWKAGSFSDMPMSIVLASRRAQTQTASAAAAGPTQIIDYQVYIEPTHQRWLYALETPEPRDLKVELTWNYRLLARDAVHDKFSYRARAYVGRAMDLDLEKRLRARTLALPADSNPRARQWAQALRADVASDEQFIAAVLDYFRQQPFFYTLKPPLLGAQPVDEFLFDSRKGFCEHYASSFVFAMRAAGVPARIVAGYQGGERNPLTGTVQVRQFDAHAWAEVWLADKGWIRVDPTAAVAPQRIERGLESALTSGEFLANSPFSANRYRSIEWVNQLRLRLDVVNYNWTRWVVNYHEDTQTSVLENLLGGVSAWRLGLLLVGGGAIALALVAFLLLGRPTRVHESAQLRLYRRFQHIMARRGYPCPPGMTPQAYARWLRSKNQQSEIATQIADSFSELSYRELDEKERGELLKRLRSAVFKLRLG